MKILLTTFWNMPLTGGVGSYLSGLKKGLEQSGHVVHTFGQQAGVTGSYTVNDTVKLLKQTVRKAVAIEMHRFFNRTAPHTPARIKTAEIERYSFELAAAYMNLEQYDVIHCQDVISARSLSRVKPPSAPLIATIHGCLTYELYLARAITTTNVVWNYQVTQEHVGVTAPSITIVPTNWLKKLMSERFKAPVHHMNVIPYGIDIDNFREQMKQSTDVIVPSNKCVIVCPARLDPVKGHAVLFDALSRLKRQRHDWVCLILGDGMLRSTLERRRQQLKLNEYVYFLGNRNDVPAIINAADIMVLSSLQDNQPFAVMEAQAAGKPVVVSNVGGIPEMVKHGETGLIFPAGRSDILANSLAMLMNNVGLRNRLGERSKQWATKKWSLQTMIIKTLELYGRAAQHHDC